MSKYESVLAEAASTIANAGFTEATYGECGYGDDWNALVVVSRQVLMNIDASHTLARYEQEYGEAEYLVWIRETNDGFVNVIEWTGDQFEEAKLLESNFNSAANQYYTDENRCPDCLDHPGWDSDNNLKRREPQDVCKTCYGSGTVD